MTKFVDEAGVQTFANALISSTKTINGQSIWGSGNIEISSQNSDGPIYLCVDVDAYNIRDAVLGLGNVTYRDIVALIMEKLTSLTDMGGKELITYLLQHNSTIAVVNLNYGSVDSNAGTSSYINPSYFTVVTSAMEPSSRDIHFMLIGKYITNGSTSYEITVHIPGLMHRYVFQDDSIEDHFMFDSAQQYNVYKTEVIHSAFSF